MWNRFKTLDPWLFVLPIMLMVMGVVVIFALTIDSSGPGLYQKQAISAGISLVLLILMAFVDYRSLRAWSFWLYMAGLISLVLVRFLGTEEFGAKLWIKVAGFQFQPGELLKFMTIVALAAVLSRGGPRISNRQFVLAAIYLIIPVLAILLQPDLGTALVIAVSGVAIMLHARLSRMQKILVIAGVVCAVSVVILSFEEVKPFNHVLKEYQKDRLLSFVEPNRDESGSGYNVLQSVIAVGSGGISGKGLGNGSQSQLNFLPVAQADFIFAVIAEAWGLVGAWGTLALFGLLLFRTLQAGRIAKDDFGALICAGVTAKIIFEVLVNVGMNIRLMPVTGIPLPFLSYGGTALLTNALLMGTVQSIVMRYKRLTF